MAKKQKMQQPKVEAPVVEAPVVVELVAPAAEKLTKRNATPTDAVLVKTDKAPRDRMEHTKAAWAVVVATLPATAKELETALEAAKFDDATKAKLVSFRAYLSYMIRRKALAVKAD